MDILEVCIGLLAQVRVHLLQVALHRVIRMPLDLIKC